MGAQNNDQVASRIRMWLEDAVVGLRLCPFAPPVLGGLRLVVSEARTPEDAVRVALGEVLRLVEDDAVPTTLIAFAHALEDFEEFLDVAAEVQEALALAGAEGLLQVATFHPDYQFEGTSPDDLGNFTNRSPYPVLHLLREDEVADAVAGYPDPDAIPRDNVARLEDLGRLEVERRWRRFSRPH